MKGNPNLASVAALAAVAALSAVAALWPVEVSAIQFNTHLQTKDTVDDFFFVRGGTNRAWCF